jgi:hypothetical protein
MWWPKRKSVPLSGIKIQPITSQFTDGIHVNTGPKCVLYLRFLKLLLGLCRSAIIVLHKCISVWHFGHRRKSQFSGTTNFWKLITRSSSGDIVMQVVLLRSAPRRPWYVMGPSVVWLFTLSCHLIKETEPVFESLWFKKKHESNENFRSIRKISGRYIAP